MDTTVYHGYYRPYLYHSASSVPPESSPIVTLDLPTNGNALAVLRCWHLLPGAEDEHEAGVDGEHVRV
jgi:hypothetical protein